MLLLWYYYDIKQGATAHDLLRTPSHRCSHRWRKMREFLLYLALWTPKFTLSKVRNLHWKINFSWLSTLYAKSLFYIFIWSIQKKAVPLHSQSVLRQFGAPKGTKPMAVPHGESGDRCCFNLAVAKQKPNSVQPSRRTAKLIVRACEERTRSNFAVANVAAFYRGPQRNQANGCSAWGERRPMLL